MKLKINIEQYDLIMNLFNINSNRISDLVDIKNEKEAMSYFNNIKNRVLLTNSYIESDAATFAELREIVANYLMVSDSFDKNYNPTKFGSNIEYLIDLFNV
jgi:hypothetical protein